MENEIMEQNQQIKRSPYFRICMGLLWLIPVYFVTNMIIGAIIGAIAGVEAQNHQVAYSAGYAASTAFFQQYGWIVFAF